MIDALQTIENAVFVVGYGPLFSGARRYGPRVLPLAEFNVSRFFSGFDAAICAAGYNTYEELLAARVPTLFYAQEKGLDRQDLRIANGVSRNWHGALTSFEAHDMRESLEGLLKSSNPFPALISRPVPQGAIRAAAEIFELGAVAADCGVDANQMNLATAWRLSVKQHKSFIAGAALALHWLKLCLPIRDWRSIAFSAQLAMQRKEYDETFEWTESILAISEKLAELFEQLATTKIESTRLLKQLPLSIARPIQTDDLVQSRRERLQNVDVARLYKTFSSHTSSKPIDYRP